MQLTGSPIRSRPSLGPATVRLVNADTLRDPISYPTVPKSLAKGARSQAVRGAATVTVPVPVKRGHYPEKLGVTSAVLVRPAARSGTITANDNDAAPAKGTRIETKKDRLGRDPTNSGNAAIKLEKANSG